MKVFTLNKEILLPIPIKQAWSFFSNPVNLKRITPPEMNFDIISGNLPEKIFSGLMIQYSVSPLKGIKMKWLSEIKHVNEPFSFTDEQRSGPYSFWYHQHSFAEMGSNTRMTDLVYYSLPFFAIGSIAHSLFIRKKLEHIFNYRTKAIFDIFKIKEI
jgi:ligand-binding SRPBCC domain-containing protein